jgi:pimeloyl-ACP methyl ester carboxylesterase
MKLAIAALALLTASTAWAGAGDLHLQPCKATKVKQPSKCGTFTVWENRAAKSRTHARPERPRAASDGCEAPSRIRCSCCSAAPGEAATSGGDWYSNDPSLADRDIVLVDARGTGKSNGLHCPLPKDGSLQVFLPTLNVPVLTACRAELEKHADLRYYLTTYAMDDLDDLRAALGYDKINLDGASYGTRAALVYIRQHGEHVRTATLWGSTAMTQPMPLHFATDAEHALQNVFRDCEAEPACKAAFPTLQADYKRTVERAEQGPVRVTVKDPRNNKATEVDLHPDDFAESLRGMIYQPESMRSIPLLLHKAASGNYQAFADYQIGRNVDLNEEILRRPVSLRFTCTEDIDRIDPQQLTANGRGTFLADHRARPHVESCKGMAARQAPGWLRRRSEVRCTGADHGRRQRSRDAADSGEVGGVTTLQRPRHRRASRRAQSSGTHQREMRERYRRAFPADSRSEVAGCLVLEGRQAQTVRCERVRLKPDPQQSQACGSGFSLTTPDRMRTRTTRAPASPQP